jgi:Arc/MetJ-type ribon-helix-helix transcriptional regulator
MRGASDDPRNRCGTADSRPRRSAGVWEARTLAPDQPGYIARCYTDRMAQIVTRLDDELAAAVDELVADGVVASRSEAVRIGLERLVDRIRRDRIGAAIANGYREHPQTEEEISWANAATKRMIADEPW